MEEFNENPFLKNTPVRIFSDSIDFMVWKEYNCDQCTKYESESTSEDEAVCKLAYHIDCSTLLGTIPLHIAKSIGCDYVPLYGRCDLHSQCRERLIEGQPF